MIRDEVAGGRRQERAGLDSIRKTLRHEFVNFRDRPYAYYDMALPIGEGQTISPPFIVAYMTEQLDPQPTDKVLEIGTGSGYQAAVLSPLVKEVYTIEIVEPLGRQAARVLQKLKYKNVFTKIGDGYQGWPENAPFDKIIVTCSPEKVPQPLVDQLKEGGRLIVPLGERYQQMLYLFMKKNGKLVSEALRPTLFVPMTGKAEALRENEARRGEPEDRQRQLRGDRISRTRRKCRRTGTTFDKRSSWPTRTEAPDGKQFIVFTQHHARPRLPSAARLRRRRQARQSDRGDVRSPRRRHSSRRDARPDAARGDHVLRRAARRRRRSRDRSLARHLQMAAREHRNRSSAPRQDGHHPHRPLRGPR